MSEGDKIKVIIVDDIAETRENFRKLLQFERDIEVVGIARTGREGIDLARDVSPDVVLMDINMPDMDGISATEIIRKEMPFTQIVILSVQGDPNYMRRAMLAGARDFLTKPPMVDELISAIRRAGSMAHDERKKAAKQAPVRTDLGASGEFVSRAGSLGKIVVVYSPKGGVGATTVATNLAVTLHNEETPVVLVDGNLQFGDIAVMLNERGKNSIVDLAPRSDELDPDVISEVLIKHDGSGIKALACPPQPQFAENVTGEQFGKILQYLRRIFSYVIVDTSSTLTDAVLNSIDNCAVLVLIATQDIPSINNSRLFLDLADVLGFDRSRIVFIMNRFDKRIGITPEAVGENLKIDVDLVLPLDERIVVPSINRGVPFVLNNKGKPISRSIMDLAETVRQRITEMESVEN